MSCFPPCVSFFVLQCLPCVSMFPQTRKPVFLVSSFTPSLPLVSSTPVLCPSVSCFIVKMSCFHVRCVWFCFPCGVVYFVLSVLLMLVFLVFSNKALFELLFACLGLQLGTILPAQHKFVTLNSKMVPKAIFPPTDLLTGLL